MFVVVKEVLIYGEDFFVDTEKWDHLQTFELEQLVYLVEYWNICMKVAVDRITMRPTQENLHNVLVAEGVVLRVSHGGISPTNTCVVDGRVHIQTSTLARL
jgi:hypothetical protein